MKLNDAVWGAVLVLLAVAILVHVQSFSTIPGQKYGPAIFPGLAACGLAICGALLIYQGFTARSAHAEGASWITFAPWTHSPRHLFAFALTIFVNVFYIYCVDWLGFIPTSVIYLSVLFAAFGVSWKWNLPIALVLTLAIHTVFYKLLRVPLPWGLLRNHIW